jgi:hypothetical protein
MVKTLPERTEPENRHVVDETVNHIPDKVQHNLRIFDTMLRHER